MTIKRWFSRLFMSLVFFTAMGIGSLGSISWVGAQEYGIHHNYFDLGVPGATSGYGRIEIPGMAHAYAYSEFAGAGGAGDIERDPWEPFNESMFSFNRNLDRAILKPVATVWDAVLPDPAQKGLGNLFNNFDVVPRFVNNLLQLKFGGAGRELVRFTLNSTIGIVGLFDPAKAFGIKASNEDMGQTLGVYGAGPGPYLVLPFLPVMTVRDGVGFAIDGAMNPLNYILPYAAKADFWTTTGTILAIGATDAVNTRSRNLKFYEGVEESAVDLYSAVRNAYLQKRKADIADIND